MPHSRAVRSCPLDRSSERTIAAVAPTVLVVDDEKNIRRTLEMVLEGEGYRVLEAESAEQALADARRTRSTPVDLAIFDLKLPGHERARGARAAARATRPRATCRSS